jgi:hypothetical protein
MAQVMPMTRWIEDRGTLVVDEIGFLVRMVDHAGTERHVMWWCMPYSERTGEPTPRGDCGCRDGVSYTALGVWQLIQSGANGRVRIKEITERDKLILFLRGVGYPELIEECLPPDTGTR